MRKAGIDETVTAARVVKEGQISIVRLLGAEISVHVEVISLKDGILKLITSSPSAAHMIRSIEKQWINEINRALGERKVLGLHVERKGF